MIDIGYLHVIIIIQHSIQSIQLKHIMHALEINNFAHLLCFHPNLHRSGCQLAVSCITCITQTGTEIDF